MLLLGLCSGWVWDAVESFAQRAEPGDCKFGNKVNHSVTKTEVEAWPVEATQGNVGPRQIEAFEPIPFLKVADTAFSRRTKFDYTR